MVGILVAILIILVAIILAIIAIIRIVAGSATAAIAPLTLSCTLLLRTLSCPPSVVIFFLAGFILFIPQFLHSCMCGFILLLLIWCPSSEITIY